MISNLYKRQNDTEIKNWFAIGHGTAFYNKAKPNTA